ncbi:MAG TPA: hypothetical protein H9962_03390 [Candidatus Mailhella merdigallinarum]|uniref:Uncharacterized protein n=1 Tax=Candidatus Mailhella merdigallinarum TaxID=2838658 RepID=A0A9D2KKJ8_9BACT|nr:hypothetical protein [Desulfovibrionaceae bacterium]HJA08220.1 hypothetical protein [Candidatus Mailhella merdigallinarum]
MTAQWSLVLYTLLTQWAAGLAVFTAWKTRRALRAGERPSGPAWAPVTAAAALGLVMSLFGQWHPGELLPGLEGLAFTVLLAVAFMAWHLRGGKILSVLAASAGVVGVLLQGLRCAPLPAPSPVGVLFLWMFALGAWTLGASFAQLGRGSEQGFARPLRLGLWLLLVTLVLVPCLGGTFVDTLMRLLSVAWMEFLPYWAAVMATGVAIGLSYMGRATAPVQAALVLVAAFCVRATMFVGGADLFL